MEPSSQAHQNLIYQNPDGESRRTRIAHRAGSSFRTPYCPGAVACKCPLHDPRAVMRSSPYVYENSYPPRSQLPANGEQGVRGKSIRTAKDYTVDLSGSSLAI